MPVLLTFEGYFFDLLTVNLNETLLSDWVQHSTWNNALRVALSKRFVLVIQFFLFIKQRNLHLHYSQFLTLLNISYTNYFTSKRLLYFSFFSYNTYTIPLYFFSYLQYIYNPALLFFLLTTQYIYSPSLLFSYLQYIYNPALLFFLTYNTYIILRLPIFTYNTIHILYYDYLQLLTPTYKTAGRLTADLQNCYYLQFSYNTTSNTTSTYKWMSRLITCIYLYENQYYFTLKAFAKTLSCYL